MAYKFTFSIQGTSDLFECSVKTRRFRNATYF